MGGVIRDEATTRTIVEYIIWEISTELNSKVDTASVATVSAISIRGTIPKPTIKLSLRLSPKDLEPITLPITFPKIANVTKTYGIGLLSI